jgi:hypothetical protein
MDLKQTARKDVNSVHVAQWRALAGMAEKAENFSSRWATISDFSGNKGTQDEGFQLHFKTLEEHRWCRRFYKGKNVKISNYLNSEASVGYVTLSCWNSKKLQGETRTTQSKEYLWAVNHATTRHKESLWSPYTGPWTLCSCGGEKW